MTKVRTLALALLTVATLGLAAPSWGQTPHPHDIDGGGTGVKKSQLKYWPGHVPEATPSDSDGGNPPYYSGYPYWNRPYYPVPSGYYHPYINAYPYGYGRGVYFNYGNGYTGPIYPDLTRGYQRGYRYGNTWVNPNIGNSW